MKLALALQLLLLVYHQLTTLFDFYPFNGARFAKPKERGAEAALNFALMVIAPVGFLFGLSGPMRFGAVFYFILLGCEIATWFVPYLIGASPRWEEAYSRIQGRTIMLLPRRGRNPTPNLEHLLLMVLTLAAAISTLAAYRSLPNPRAPGWATGGVVCLLIVSGIAATHWKLPGRGAASRAQQARSALS